MATHLFRLFGHSVRPNLRMRIVPILLLAAAAPVWAAADPALQQIKTVYLLPMGSGLDQYLASHLAEERLFDVVTDPALADAVLTDRIGPAFEEIFLELYPPPAPPPAPAPPPDQAKTAEKAKPEMPARDTIGDALASTPDSPRRISSFSRGRGNVFLVDRRTRRVLWSDFRRVNDTRPKEMNRVADRLIDSLEGDLNRLRKATNSQ